MKVGSFWLQTTMLHKSPCPPQCPNDTVVTFKPSAYHKKGDVTLHETLAERSRQQNPLAACASACEQKTDLSHDTQTKGNCAPACGPQHCAANRAWLRQLRPSGMLICLQDKSLCLHGHVSTGGHPWVLPSRSANADPDGLRGHPAVQQREQVVTRRRHGRAGWDGGHALHDCLPVNKKCCSEPGSGQTAPTAVQGM